MQEKDALLQAKDTLEHEKVCLSVAAVFSETVCLSQCVCMSVLRMTKSESHGGATEGNRAAPAKASS